MCENCIKTNYLPVWVLVYAANKNCILRITKKFSFKSAKQMELFHVTLEHFNVWNKKEVTIW